MKSTEMCGAQNNGHYFNGRIMVLVYQVEPCEGL